MTETFSAQQFVEPLERLARGLGASLSVATVDGITRYLALVAEWNAKFDLTAARTADAMTEVLVADAIVLARPGLIEQGAHVVDVGTGAGGPAVPLLLLRPDLRATLVEPLHKRVTFLRVVLHELDLSQRATIIDKKLDPKKPKVAGTPTVAMSRATLPPVRWLPLGTLLAPTTLVLTVRPDPLPLPKGVTLAATETYQLPFSGAPRAIQSCRRG